MTILELGEIGEFLYCPLTGKQMLGEEDLEEVQGVVAFWALEVPDEPSFIKDEQLQEQWDKYLTAFFERDEDEEYESDLPEPDVFLESIENPNLYAIKFCQWGMACGPVWDWGIIVMDKSKALESIDSEGE